MAAVSDKISHLGQPDVKPAGLFLWIHGHEFPDSGDDWDENWLNATVYCEDIGASALTVGPIIHLTEIRDWHADITNMHETFSREKILGGALEPNLRVDLILDKLGHIAMTVEITPDHLTHQQRFCFKIPQNDLEHLLVQCKSVLDEYPVRGTPQRSQ